MSDPLFDPKAAKQTVSITLNSDLYAKTKSLGINVSKIAEQALATEYSERRREAIRAEVQKDLAAVDGYAEQHGSFADLVREHYERDEAVGDEAVGGEPVVGGKSTDAAV